MELDRPLHEGSAAERGAAAGGGAADPPELGGGPATGESPSRRAGLLLLDAALSAAFWCTAFLVPWSVALFLALLAALLAAMVAWRRHLARRPRGACPEPLPYTCGFVSSGGKELFLVATVHISPRAPRDVEAVIGTVRPDVVLIELDEERLDDMREAETPRDLQPFEATEAGCEPISMLAQRALWNGEHSGQTIAGGIVYDDANPYGVGHWCPEVCGSLAFVRRGGPEDAGRCATFTAKAHSAARAGASALLVVNSAPELPACRVGTGPLLDDLRVALHTRSCAFPPVPVLLLPRESGEQLLGRCQQRGLGCLRGSFQVVPDTYPRRTLRRRLCQACALTLSGFGALYWVIDCLSVEVGEEFVTAEATASARGIQCSCIDVDMDNLCNRVRAALLPTPCNLGRALCAWLAFPRALLSALFPPPSSLDVIGGTVLHMMSFRVRTWVALTLAALCAGAIAGGVLALFGRGVASAATGTGAVSKKDSGELQAYVMLFLEAFVAARLYDAVAASRDEAMYRGIRARASGRSCRRLVAVVGAAHANGILRRAREGGL